ncbi:MAG: alpha/beta hydrolase [Deltaproteobacteria bacterium]|nr:alpha/beta hydrolase [Deltaproteobacteria bacterium]MBW2393266.1 alpha/beta hydrolase [Deltaproteobacteria bacterium]
MPSATEIIGPSSHFYVSQRLRLHYVDWGNESAPPLLLIHGGKDHARSWDPIARELRRDWHVIAPDLRGHGDSAWAIGGSYSLPDFVLDIAQLVEALELAPLTIVAHSLGGAIALHYTGVFPEKVSRLVAIEGLGPAPDLAKRLAETPVHERFSRWVIAAQELATRSPRRYASIDEAAQRMQQVNSFLPPDLARHLTIHGVARNEDHTFSWKFDNYVRAFSPVRLPAEDLHALWERISCPVLLVRGMESWASDPEKDGRAEHFSDAQLVNVESAGHWVHHDQPEVFLEAVRTFLS